MSRFENMVANMPEMQAMARMAEKQFSPEEPTVLKEKNGIVLPKLSRRQAIYITALGLSAVAVVGPKIFQGEAMAATPRELNNNNIGVVFNGPRIDMDRAPFVYDEAGKWEAAAKETTPEAAEIKSIDSMANIPIEELENRGIDPEIIQAIGEAKIWNLSQIFSYQGGRSINQDGNLLNGTLEGTFNQGPYTSPNRVVNLASGESSTLIFSPQLCSNPEEETYLGLTLNRMNQEGYSLGSIHIVYFLEVEDERSPLVFRLYNDNPQGEQYYSIEPYFGGMETLENSRFSVEEDQYVMYDVDATQYYPQLILEGGQTPTPTLTSTVDFGTYTPFPPPPTEEPTPTPTETEKTFLSYGPIIVKGGQK